MTGSARAQEFALHQVVQRNLYSFIPPQCYTKTLDAAGKAHNPCFTCHVGSRAPNYINDGEVQLAYDFVPGARSNRWSNLFVDWLSVGPAETEEQALRYIRRSNYFDARGAISLAQRLSPPPPEWDARNDGLWSGYVPDAHFRFDARGFDRQSDGTTTGWRAYGYHPLPGTFWPTNGSAGDALVRLPEAFRRNEAGEADLAIYELNLAIVEALVARRDVVIEPSDERRLGVDLDLDGKRGLAKSVRGSRASSAPGASLGFVGQARLELAAGRLHAAAGLFPEGTEFLHTLRYLDTTDSGVSMAARLKELRYARKAEWWTEQRLDKRARAEAEEKVDSPAEQRGLGGDLERGVSNGQGWWYQGFIEDADGALRPQTFEETTYCVGCHGGIGRTDDGVFSFSRRLGSDSPQRGWFHWSQRGLQGIPDRPVHGGSVTEYVAYLEENGAADEFRQNDEAQKKFFDRGGRLKPEMRERLKRDIAELLIPSAERAMALNRAYRALVKTQSFRDGRDVLLGGAQNLHRAVPPGERTGIRAPVAPPWQRKRHAEVPAP